MDRVDTQPSERDSLAHDIEPSRQRNENRCVTTSKLRVYAGEKQAAGWLLPVIFYDQTRRQPVQGSRVHSLRPHGVRAAHRAFGVAFTFDRPVRDQDICAALFLILRKVPANILVTKMVLNFIATPSFKGRAFVARHATHFKAPCASVSPSWKNSGRCR